jgi:hypothetical protein
MLAAFCLSASWLAIGAVQITEAKWLVTRSDFVAQKLGALMLIKRASGDDLTDVTDPSRIMMHRIAGSDSTVPMQTTRAVLLVVARTRFGYAVVRKENRPAVRHHEQAASAE